MSESWLMGDASMARVRGNEFAAGVGGMDSARAAEGRGWRSARRPPVTRVGSGLKEKEDAKESEGAWTAGECSWWSWEAESALAREEG